MEILSAIEGKVYSPVAGCILMGISSVLFVGLAIFKKDGKELAPTSDAVGHFIFSDGFILGMTLLLSWGPLIFLGFYHSVFDVNDILSQTRHSEFLYGWTLTFVVIYHLIAPFVVLKCLHIGRRRRLQRFGYA